MASLQNLSLISKLAEVGGECFNKLKMLSIFEASPAHTDGK